MNLFHVIHHATIAFFIHKLFHGIFSRFYTFFHFLLLKMIEKALKIFFYRQKNVINLLFFS